MMRKLTLGIGLLLIGFLPITAKTMKIHVQKPGTLDDYVAMVAPKERLKITSLVLSGKLNGDDIIVLRSLVGITRNQSPTRGRVTSVDLSEVEFVYGGDWYIEHNGLIYLRENGTVPKFLFRNCNIEEVILPKNAKKIGEGALEYTKLKKVVIPESCQEIGNYAFYNCWELTEIVAPQRLSYMGFSAFASSDKLRKIEFGIVEEIANNAIENCKNLEEIVFAGRVKKANGAVALNCPSLKKIEFRGGLDQSRGPITKDCPKLSKVTVYQKGNPQTIFGI